MNSPRQPDAIDRLLRQSLRETAEPAPPDGCLEPDTLAAWIDGALTRDERARAELHAAGCARCQAMLSAMARTAPAVAPRSWWAHATVRWLVPIATVAAMALLWIALPPRPDAPVADKVMATRAEPKAAPSVPAIGPPPPAASDERARKAGITRAAPAAAAPKPTIVESLPAGGEGKPQDTVLRRELAKDVLAIDSVGVVAAPPADQSEPRRPLGGARPAAAAAPPPPARAVGGLAANESVAPAEPPLAFAAGRSLLKQTDIASPDAAVRWRLAGIGAVQRSTDGGVTWTTQLTGTTVPVSAGSSPSARVCWLVGRAATILLSTDGTTWLPRPFPEGADLVAVRAVDATSATVTTADGRQFLTTDGGATWTRAQEFPPAPFYQ